MVEAARGFEPRSRGFADVRLNRLATPPSRWREPVDRREVWSGKRDSNPRPRPWQGRALPLSYSRATAVDFITISSRACPQHVGGVLRRHRIDEEPAAPLEAGHPRELGDDLQMPVERLEMALAKRRRVQHEVERRIAQDPVQAPRKRTPRMPRPQIQSKTDITPQKITQ